MRHAAVEVVALEVVVVDEEVGAVVAVELDGVEARLEDEDVVIVVTGVAEDVDI